MLYWYGVQPVASPWVEPSDRADKRAVSALGNVPPVEPVQRSPQSTSASVRPYADAGRSHSGLSSLPLLAYAIMAAPAVAVASNESVGGALAKLEEHGFRHLPIVDEAGRLTGIVSDRDILRHLAGPHSPQEHPRLTQLSSIMTTPVLSARSLASVHELAGVMFRHRLGALPITDDQDNLVGIVTRSDILRTAMQRGALSSWL